MRTIRLLMTCIAVLVSGHIIAQTFYGKSEIIVRDTVRYVCINDGGAISLYNQDTVFVNVPQTLKNGDPIESAISYSDMIEKPGYELSKELKDKLNEVLHHAFVPYEPHLRGNDKRLLITLLATSEEKAVVKDVIFDMVQSYDNYIHVPPEVFMKLERVFKRIKIPTTEFGRQLNYIAITLTYTFV